MCQVTDCSKTVVQTLTVSKDRFRDSSAQSKELTSCSRAPNASTMGKRVALPVVPTLKHSMHSTGSVPLLKGWKAWSVCRTEVGFSPATCTALPGPSQASTESSGLWKDIMRLACLSPSSSVSPRSDCVPGTLDLGAHQGLVFICSLTFTKDQALPHH